MLLHRRRCGSRLLAAAWLPLQGGANAANVTSRPAATASAELDANQRHIQVLCRDKEGDDKGGV